MAISFCASYSLGGGSKYDSFQIDVSVFRTKCWGVSWFDEVEDEEFWRRLPINQITEQRLNQRIMIQGEVWFLHWFNENGRKFFSMSRRIRCFFRKKSGGPWFIFWLFSSERFIRLSVSRAVLASVKIRFEGCKGENLQLSRFNYCTRKYGLSRGRRNIRFALLPFERSARYPIRKTGTCSYLRESMSSKTIYVQIRDRLSATLTDFNLVIVPSRFEEMLYFLNYLSFRMAETAVSLAETEIPLLQSLHVHQVSSF